jgi:hypothetical protein
MPNQNDIRQAITNQIISALESGNVLLWRCPEPGPHRQPRTSLSVTGSPTLSPANTPLPDCGSIALVHVIPIRSPNREARIIHDRRIKSPPSDWSESSSPLLYARWCQLKCVSTASGDVALYTSFQEKMY